MAFDPAAYKKGTLAGVLGCGTSGLAAARLLLDKGFRVLVSDSAPQAELTRRLKGLPRRILREGGGHSKRLLRCAFVVKSPGLAPALPILSALRQAGVPVFSEMEVGLAFSRSRELVAVTGTNGKTTTALLTAAIFRAAGRRSRPCGNLGLPFCERAAAAGARDVLIAEVSSYQLEDSTSFRPQAAALLNVTADHLEHHGSMERYLKAKARCFAEMGPQESAVFNADDPLCLRVARQTAARKYFFASAAGTRVQAWIEGPRIAIRLDGKPALRLVPPPLPGRHNLANAMAAALLALSRGVKPAAIQRAFKSFKGVEHRLEDCGVFRGLRCVNDSKATNVDSTLAALEALRPPRQTPNILLILGGLHKGSPYTPLRQELERSVKGVLTIGSAARKIEEDLAGAVPVFACGELSVAVETAFKIGAAGDLLLLSPACASFDQFKNFEERGRLFKKLVRQGR